jgi:hypothetical protein
MVAGMPFSLETEVYRRILKNRVASGCLGKKLALNIFPSDLTIEESEDKIKVSMLYWKVEDRKVCQILKEDIQDIKDYLKVIDRVIA